MKVNTFILASASGAYKHGSDTEPSNQVFFLQVNVYGCFLLILFSSQLDADQRNKLFSITLLWFKDEKVRYLNYFYVVLM